MGGFLKPLSVVTFQPRKRRENKGRETRETRGCIALVNEGKAKSRISWKEAKKSRASSWSGRNENERLMYGPKSGSLLHHPSPRDKWVCVCYITVVCISCWCLTRTTETQHQSCPTLHWSTYSIYTVPHIISLYYLSRFASVSVGDVGALQPSFRDYEEQAGTMPPACVCV